MKLFKRKVTKLEERLLSLEQYIGAAHLFEDGYSEHVARKWGELPDVVKELEKLKDQKEAKK